MTPYFSNGLATLYHGDALEVLPTLPSVDLVVTDPPYVIGAVSAGSGPVAVAASRLGVASISIEAEERWCEPIASRLDQGALDLAELAN